MKFAINKVRTGLGELQTTLNFHLQIPKGPTAVGSLPEELEMRCTGFTTPKPVSTDTQIKIGGHTLNFVGKTEKAGTITLTFVEGTDAKVTAYFRKWQNARWASSGGDTTGKQSKTVDCQCDITLNLLGPDDEVTQVHQLIGAMVTEMGEVTTSQEAEGVMPTVTISYIDSHIKAGTFSTM